MKNCYCIILGLCHMLNTKVKSIKTYSFLTSANPSLRLWRRSTSSISYTLISKGSFMAPPSGGRSTHWPAAPTFLPSEEVSGRGAGIRRRRCRPGGVTQGNALHVGRRWTAEFAGMLLNMYEACKMLEDLKQKWFWGKCRLENRVNAKQIPDMPNNLGFLNLNGRNRLTC